MATAPTTPTTANTVLPPPRRTGQTTSDLLMQLRWFNDFYDQIEKVLNVPGVIQTLNDTGLLAAPNGWFDAVTKQLTDLTTSVNDLTTAMQGLTTAVASQESALTLSGIFPVVESPGANNTGIHLLLNNNAGVNAPRVTLSVPDGGGAGFRALLVPN